MTSVVQLFDLTGKVAVITGGGRGLGQQIAEGFAEAGAHIVLCSRNEDACKEAAKQLNTMYGAQVLSMKCDVTNAEDVINLVETTMNKFGHIDILVNNSGASWGAPMEEMPLVAWQKVMNVNTTGTFLMSQAVGKVMLEQGTGKIINIASIAGLKGSNPDALDAIGYSTSKGAVISFTKDLAVKWGSRGIYVNAIAPGFFPTKMTKDVIAHGSDRLLQNTPLKRFGDDKDLKGVALFLASAASDYVTGAIIPVDGGSSAT